MKVLIEMDSSVRKNIIIQTGKDPGASRIVEIDDLSGASPEARQALVERMSCGYGQDRRAEYTIKYASSYDPVLLAEESLSLEEAKKAQKAKDFAEKIVEVEKKVDGYEAGTYDRGYYDWSSDVLAARPDLSERIKVEESKRSMMAAIALGQRIYAYLAGGEDERLAKSAYDHGGILADDDPRKAAVREEADRRKEKAEAVKAEKEAARLAEIEAWIAEHGSPRLQRIVTEGFLPTSANVYRDERLAIERPGWRWARNVPGESSDAKHPTDEAFALLDEARKVDPDAELAWWMHDVEDEATGEENVKWSGYVVIATFLDRDIVLGGPRK